MLAEGASIDEDVVFALNAAWTKSRNKKANMESTKETFRNEPLQDRDDSRPWEAPSKLTPTLHTPAEETPMQDIPPQQAVQAQFPDNGNHTSPFKSALKSRKRSPLPNGDQDDTPRKRVRISQPSTPIADQSSKADLNPRLGRKARLDSPESTESIPEVRRTPRGSQPRLQPKDMVSWKDANESLRGMRPR
nr:hypothetical protein CFP56_22489 [Quercus suber]